MGMGSWDGPPDGFGFWLWALLEFLGSIPPLFWLLLFAAFSGILIVQLG